MRKFRELKPSELRWQCDPKLLKFRTVADLKTHEGIIGQPRAMDAIKLGLNVKYPGYNIFITGPVGTGRTTAITKLLGEIKVKKGKLLDLTYVNNFKNPDMPKLIDLPAGDGNRFKNAMLKLIGDLKSNIPEVFSSEEYQKRRQNIVNKYEEENRLLLRDFEKKVEEEGFKVVQIQAGPFVRPAIFPIIDKKPTKLEEIDKLVKEGKLTEDEYKEIQEKLKKLETDLASIYGRVRELQDEANEKIHRLNEIMVKPVVSHLIDAVKKKFNNKKIDAYLKEVLNSVMKDLGRFLKKDGKEDAFREYQVNVLVDNSETELKPIIFETTPSYKNLFGTIERHSAGPGILVSDFLNIKAGSLLRANGGYLVINAFDALIEPGVWQTLKRTLRNGVIDIQAFDPFYIFTTTALKPEPINIDVKVVMIGSQWLYYLLYYRDEDFKKIFKVKADFDTVMEKNKENVNQYASFVKSICHTEGLLPFSKEAIADIVEYGVRIAGRKDKLSTRFHVIADIIREADYWARQKKKKSVEADDVEKAIQGWRRRVNMLEDKIQEMIEKNILMITTKGKAVGQVNGLSVYQVGGYSFGKPTKITAKTSLGRAGIINIEREANLGGKTYNKGVLILSGFLKSRYAQNQPLAIDATLGFEQSYSEVDGDSASSAEVYALLSSLSGIPLNQELAVTGSVNQNGEIQPIGGVNQKIEGFFDVCKAKGFTGNQGVIIPESNVDDLMLRQEVVDAVKKRKFHIYAVKTIDQGIELLTGVKAGRRTKTGFEKDSINYLVEKKLGEYAAKMKGFSKNKK
ncbi:MAG TPA: ATP-binding protein [candidate division WOR-3 bacterium]|uniref:endopeptidase La n=1 Tax=candidate division WOR-3 bacterium TaxID=2052148 RepID=A0A9C9ENP1_UNCW3|nr:ATP-binding protein [candidate division WOR-3 bacterium]